MKKLITTAKSFSILIYLSLTFLSHWVIAKEVQVVFPGKPLVNAAKVNTYSGEWRQLLLKDGAWVASGSIREELTAIDEKYWQHVQSQFSAKGDSQAKVSVIRKLRKSDLFTEALQQKLPSSVKVGAKSISAKFGNHQIQREIIDHDNQVKKQQVELPFDGFDGFILGLALSGLPLEDGKLFRLPSVIANFLNGYWVDAAVSDGGTVSVNGQPHPVWFVDVSWLNIHDGETYLPGPDASGGRYTIFKEQPKGVPAVYRYKTDSLDIILKD